MKKSKIQMPKTEYMCFVHRSIKGKDKDELDEKLNINKIEESVTRGGKQSYFQGFKRSHPGQKAHRCASVLA